MTNINERGSVMTNVVLAILLVAGGVLVYLLVGGDAARIGRTGGVDAMPVIETDGSDEFPDGLINPAASRRGTLDEFGVGTAQTDVFNRDLDNDGRMDRIVRRRIENGTAHFYYDYKIELNNGGGYTDITPAKFRTTEGAECALAKLQFSFNPVFQIIHISRPWQDTWSTPTKATKTVYTLQDDVMHAGTIEDMGIVCDVAELF